MEKEQEKREVDEGKEEGEDAKGEEEAEEAFIHRL